VGFALIVSLDKRRFIGGLPFLRLASSLASN
jgi:hypothetical protein